MVGCRLWDGYGIYRGLSWGMGVALSFSSSYIVVRKRP